MYKLDLEKAEDPEQIANIHWIIERARESQKKTYPSLATLKAFDCVDQKKNCGKFLKRWEYQTTLPAFCGTGMQVKKQQLELDIGQQTGFKSGKEYVRAVYCHPAYLISIQSTSCDMPGWITHKLASRLPGDISIASDMQVTPPLSKEELKYL